MAQKRLTTIYRGQYENFDPGDYIEGGFKLADDNFLELYPTINQTFSGMINLSRFLTHYLSYKVNTNVGVSLEADEPVIGASAEIRMIGDGVHSPVFNSDFTKSPNSDDYDTTLNRVNKIVFYYDGDDAFYSITILEDV